MFRRQGIGHGDTTLADALAQSCNVYFFHFASEMGPAPLVEWARRFGFGQMTNIDLPDEAAGFVPTPATKTGGRAWSAADTQAMAIGQSGLAVTPMQVARLMAAVANGGRLVTPRLVKNLGLTETPASAEDQTTPGEALTSHRIEGLQLATLTAIREGLERVVADPQGTAHRTVFLETIAIAGKTGTAETGEGRGDHAWFAGYVPAEQPKYAFVVVLEHAGGGSDVAGPIARRLVSRLQKLGYLEPRPMVGESAAQSR